MFRAIEKGSQPNALKERLIMPLTTIQIIVVHALVASSKSKVELDSHADTCVIDDYCLSFITII